MPELQPGNADSWFASKRERRLWIWTAIVVLVIYLTMGFASTLAQWLYHQGLAAIVFAICSLVVLLMIVTQGLSIRPGGIEIGVWLGIAAVYTLLFVRLTVPERSHLVEYGVVAVLVYEALLERSERGRWVPMPPLLAIAVTTLMGAIDESIQYFLPNRVFDPMDLLFNFLAAVMAVFSMIVLRIVRHVVTNRRGKKRTTE